VSDWINPPHPLLPEVGQPLDAAELQQWGPQRHGGYHLSCLRYAQSLWRQGLPARALLALNLSLSLRLSANDPALQAWPLPYRALSWILQQRPEGQFLGNPRRHWQHLATRVRGPQQALRSWRAWACWHLAEALLPLAQFPPDSAQIVAEALAEPTAWQVQQALQRHDPDGSSAWLEAMACLGRSIGTQQSSACSLKILGPQQMDGIGDLAREIWPEVYRELLSPQQIAYMLKRSYAQETLLADLQRGVIFAQILSSNQDVAGFLALEPMPQRRAFLHKLYLLPSRIGQGLGAAALQQAAELARFWGCGELELRVNRGNHRAIRAYLRAGFCFAGELCTDIGEGFVMDDHLLRLNLNPAPHSIA
jgi:RimJ/RimL family protein N-acetyltransferase